MNDCSEPVLTSEESKMETLWSILLFILIIGVLVLVHELGHFLSSVLLGIKVEEFAIGFGPTIWKRQIVWKVKGIGAKKTTVHKITLRLNSLPLGGYVNISGQEDSKKEWDSYSERPVWQRFIVISAGVVMNFVLASLIFYVLLARTGFVHRFDYSILDVANRPIFGTETVVSEDSRLYVYPASEEELEGYSDLTWEEVQNFPSYKAGMPDWGIVISVDGDEMKDSMEFRSYVTQRVGQEVEIEVSNLENNGAKEKYKVQISDKGTVGIYFIPNSYIDIEYKGVSKVFAGFLHSINFVQYNFNLLGKFIQVAVDSGDAEVLGEVASGPIGVYQTVDAVSKRATWFWDIVMLSAFVSVNLAVVNVLPIPGFDGGFLILLIIEGFTGKRLSPEQERWVVLIGFAFIAILSVVFIVNDIVHFSDRASMFEIGN